MERAGIWKRALVVITADHGYAFEVGVATRRRTTSSNIEELAPVPLFIKAPGQRRGRTIRSYVRTVDIVPTIADILNVSPGYHVDGSSAFSRASRRRRHVRVIDRDFSGSHQHLGACDRAPARRPSSAASCGCSAWARRAARTGPSTAASDPTASCSAGRCPSSRPPPRPARARGWPSASALANVDLASELRPVHVAGTIAGRPSAQA